MDSKKPNHRGFLKGGAGIAGLAAAAQPVYGAPPAAPAFVPPRPLAPAAPLRMLDTGRPPFVEPPKALDRKSTRLNSSHT